MSEDRRIIGVDIGQARDPTAIAIVQVREGRTLSGVVFGKDGRVGPYYPPGHLKAPSRYDIGYLRRLPLQMTYPSMIAELQNLQAEFPHTEMVVDITGCGRPVYDLLRGANLRPVGVLITAGNVATRDGAIHHVPKALLVQKTAALLHLKQLKIQRELPDARVLVSELEAFRGTQQESGRWRFGARAGAHDDLLLAVTLCCWRATSHKPLRITAAHLQWARGY